MLAIHRIAMRSIRTHFAYLNTKKKGGRLSFAREPWIEKSIDGQNFSYIEIDFYFKYVPVKLLHW